jgi:methylmalonyl-CoA mutase N-terminal domain/subunit
VAAVESGVVQRLIEESAYRHAQRVESGEAVVVGVNRFATEAGDAVPALEVDPALEREQVARLAAWRAAHDSDAIDRALDTVRRTAAGTDNLLVPMKQALLAGATLGGVSAALADVFGKHHPT